MAAKTPNPALPLTFDLPCALVEKIHRCRRARGLASASATVRQAFLSFDLARYRPVRPPHRQISVRLPAALRTDLARHAAVKRVSAGELLRAALEDFSARPLEVAGNSKATQNAMKKKTAKKPAKKKAGKKPARKTKK